MKKHDLCNKKLSLSQNKTNYSLFYLFKITYNLLNHNFLCSLMKNTLKTLCKNGQVNQQASADRPVSSLLGLVRSVLTSPNKDETGLSALAFSDLTIGLT